MGRVPGLAHLFRVPCRVGLSSSSACTAAGRRWRRASPGWRASISVATCWSGKPPRIPGASGNTATSWRSTRSSSRRSRWPGRCPPRCPRAGSTIPESLRFSSGLRQCSSGSLPPRRPGRSRTRGSAGSGPSGSGPRRASARKSPGCSSTGIHWRWPRRWPPATRCRWSRLSLPGCFTASRPWASASDIRSKSCRSLPCSPIPSAWPSDYG